MHFSYPRLSKYFFPALLACMIFVGASCTLTNPSSSNPAATSANDAMEQNGALDTNDTGDVPSTPDSQGIMTEEPGTGDVMNAKRPSASVALLPQNNSGMSGVVALTEIEEGKVSVEIKMEGIPSTVARPAHIHKGACPTPGAVVHSLTNIVDERSESTLSTTFADLLAMMPLAINVHKSFAEANIFVACGDVPPEMLQAQIDAQQELQARSTSCVAEGGLTYQNVYTEDSPAARAPCCAGLVPQEQAGIADAPAVCVKPDTVSGQVSQESNTAQAPAGTYIAYSPEAYESGKDKKRVLFFHAAWCPFCKEADADFNAHLNDLPPDVVLLKIDYDRENDLKKKYGITYQHTFVQVDMEGNALTKWSGGGVQELIAQIQ